MAHLLTISVAASDTALADTFEGLSEVRFEMENTVTMQSGQQWPCLWVTGHSKEEIEGALCDDPTVTGYEHITSREDAFLYDIDVSEDGIQLRDIIQEENGAILAASGIDDYWEWKLRFRDKDDLSGLYERLKERGVSTTVERVHELDEDSEATGLLTKTQREAFETAIERGYFDIPREVELEDLAEELDISEQAVSERLRRGHESLVEAEVGEPPESTDE